MDALLERKMEAYLAGDAHRFADEDKTARQPCYYCLGDGTHAAGCPSRDDVYQVDSGMIRGAAGEIKVVRLPLERRVRVTTILAADTARPAGTGTRVTEVCVDGMFQELPSSGLPLREYLARFAPWGRDALLGECGREIAFTVSFVEACTFDLSIFGKAVV